MLDEPPDRSRDAFIQITPVTSRLDRDEREDALAVGVAAHRVEAAEIVETPIEHRKVADRPVVGEEAAVLQERMRVLHAWSVVLARRTWVTNVRPCSR